MSMSATIKSILIAALAAGAVAACSGGGTQTAEGGIGGTGISKGTVAGFASICQNGVEYLTDANTTFTINGGTATESDYVLGMVTEIEFDASTVNPVTAQTCSNGATVTNSATATGVSYSAELRGPITLAATTGGMTMQVMDQLIITDPDTKVFNASGIAVALDTLILSTVVEISGHRTADGFVLASLVRVDDSGADHKLRGVITSEVPLQIGASTIVCNLPCTLPTGLTQDVSLIEAEGNYSGSTLTANKVTLDDNSFSGEAGTETEYEGLVTLTPDDWTIVTLPQTIRIDGKPVVIDTATQYEGGLITNIVQNAKVEAEGVLDAGGTQLLADKIEFKGSSFKLEGVLDAPGSANAVQLMGVTVAVNNLTEQRDQSSAPIPNFSSADLLTGDSVEIEGKIASDGSLLALRLDKIEPLAANEMAIEGRITDIPTGSTFVIHDIVQFTVQTGITTFEDGAGNPLPGGFSALSVGDIVEAKGTYSVGQLNADKVELED